MAHAFRPEAPRWLDIVLDALRPGTRSPARLRLGPPAGPGAAWAACGGPALAAALCARDARTKDHELVLSAGWAVREGLPTAVRATITGRAPLTGLLGEGQVGGATGPALAALADALLVRGRAPREGLCLRVAAGEVELVDPGPLGATTQEALEAIARATGTPAVLAVGPAARAGVPFASIAAWGDPPHVVGRGGLGTLLARTGLVGIALDAAPPPEPGAGVEGLRAALLASPRLAARALGGTFEQAELEGAPELHDGARAARSGRHGCRGCPTPCGWVFERPGGAGGGTRFGGRFGAAEALAAGVGLEPAEALGLLGRCDELGQDAKEAGALLGLAAECGLAGVRRGDRPSCEAALEAVARGERRELARGLAAAARALGRRDVRVAKGSAVRPRGGPLAHAAACFSSRGSDPMRAFAFAPGSGLDGPALRRLVRPLALPADLAGERSLGRLLWWHESLALAVDVSGFCAFSAAGLLADGVADLDTLARWIAPPAVRAADGFEDAPGQHLLGVGDALALLQRHLCLGWGQEPGADRPAWARPGIDGIWAEYRLLRGLEADGRLTPAARARLGGARTPAPVAPGDRSGPPAAPGQAPLLPASPAGKTGGEPRAGGRLRVRSAGAIAGVLGPELELAMDLPVPLSELLEELAHRHPPARALLLAGGLPRPLVLRQGSRLGERELVGDGDCIELVLALSGG